MLRGHVCSNPFRERTCRSLDAFLLFTTVEPSRKNERGREQLTSSSRYCTSPTVTGKKRWHSCYRIACPIESCSTVSLIRSKSTPRRELIGRETNQRKKLRFWIARCINETSSLSCGLSGQVIYSPAWPIARAIVDTHLVITWWRTRLTKVTNLFLTARLRPVVRGTFAKGRNARDLHQTRPICWAIDKPASRACRTKVVSSYWLRRISIALDSLTWPSPSGEFLGWNQVLFERVSRVLLYTLPLRMSYCWVRSPLNHDRYE